MKTPDSSSDPAWDRLVARARADAPPPVDLPSLLRVVRAEPLPQPGDWREEFAALFTTRRVLGTCVACTCACAALTVWQVVDLWQAAPWAEWLTAGGVL